MALRQAELVIWDWNGTLLDDVDLVVDIMNGLLRQYGLPKLDSDLYRDLFEFPVENYYRKLGFDVAPSSFAVLATQFMDEYDRRVVDCPLKEGARETLERLVEHGIPNVILTAGKRQSVAKLIDDHGLGAVLSEVVGADDHYARAKDRVGLDWLRQRKLNPRSLILVGDTIHDYEVASAMQTRCLLVAHGHNSLDRLLHCGCPVVPSLEHLWR